MTEEALFHAALALPPAERAAWLAELCPNADIRRRVEDLLAAQDRPAGPLDSPATGAYQSAGSAAGAVGMQIGPYKLLQLIGEGGMGAVYMAEQTSPVRRMVAVKLIKPGMDSRHVLARFEAERQALALMDHPNIARVLDAGQSPVASGGQGYPYFVMELVKGVPITKYCDQQHVTPRERLELFVPVCQAVQHAHQKGIIHRDLKPSNVLVALYDGKPVPKVIDFGVAKALHQRLTDKTMFTEFGAVVGTLEYMSPEQAELNHLDVDTRSDIYSLGVLLYELLTGTTPFDRKRLKSAAFDEMLRIIREEEPPKPSTRLSGSDELPSIAANRRTEPKRLGKLVRGDLDWVVMRCLEKDRARRYETANGLAMDVQRYLADEPVQAGRPSAAYRLRKFVRRNRAAVVTAVAVFAAAILSAAGQTWNLIQAKRAKQEAVAARDAEAEQRAIAQTNERKAVAAAAAEAGERRRAQAVAELLVSIFEALDPRAEEKGGPGLKEALASQLGAAASKLGKGGAGDLPTRGGLRDALGKAYFGLGEPVLAAQLFEQAAADRAASLGSDHSDTLMTRNNQAMALLAAGRKADAARLLEKTVQRMTATLGPDHERTLMARDNLALTYLGLGRRQEAARLHEESLAAYEARLGPDHRDTLTTRNNLAAAYWAMGQLERSIPMFEETFRRTEAKLGPNHPETLMCMANLGVNYRDAGRLAEAIPLLEQVVARARSRPGPFPAAVKWVPEALAGAYTRAGRPADALKVREETLALRKEQLGPDHRDTLASMGNLASSLMALNRGAEAVPLIDECLTRAAHRDVDPRLMPTVTNLRLRHFAKASDAAGCRRTAEMWEKLNGTDAAGLYGAARFRAVTAGVAANSGTADAAGRANDDADRAMVWLRKTLAAGYADIPHLLADADLAPLRKRADYADLLWDLADMPPNPPQG